MNKTRLAGPQGAVSVIVAIGIENASKVYKYLERDEVKQPTFEVVRLDQLAAQDVEDTLDNFYQACPTQKVITEGGVEYTRSILKKVYDPQMVSSLLERVTRNLRMKVPEFIRKVDYENIIAITQSEYPQAIALISSYTSMDQAASITGELPEDVHLEIVERIAMMNRTSPEIIKIIGQNLEKKSSPFTSLDSTEIGDVNYITDIVSNVDRADEKYIFDRLTRRDATLCEETRKRMSVFEDITTLDGMSIQHFLHEVGSKSLVFALERANRETAETILRSISTRPSEGVRSDPEYTRNVRLRDVEEARQRIVGVTRRLESEGKLVIVRGGKGEFIA